MQGGGHERPEDTLSQDTAFEYWSVVQKRAQPLCKLWVSVYDECGVTEWRWWDGVVRTLPTPGLLGTSQTQTDSIWQLLGESWVRGS